MTGRVSNSDGHFLSGHPRRRVSASKAGCRAGVQPFRLTIAAIQTGAKGDVHPFETG